MYSRAVIIFDPNELRASSYASLLVPWASNSETDLHVASCLDDIKGISGYDCLACIFCVGGLSLRDEVVIDTLDDLREVFGHNPLIVFSDLCDSSEIASAIDAGLRGFLPTTMPPSVALAAIQFILAGGTHLPHSLAPPRRTPAATDGRCPQCAIHSDERPAERSYEMQRRAAEGQAPAAAPHLAAGEGLLKQRHVEVLAGLNKGHTNKVIARHLDLTEATIKLYVRQLMKIFDAGNRTQLALKATGHPQVETLLRPGTRNSLPATMAQGSADAPRESARKEPLRRKTENYNGSNYRDGQCQRIYQAPDYS